MEAPVIVVENVSKKYGLYDRPADRLKEALHPFSRRYHREFWALKDVSFSVSRGQTVGILGRNGSGKSTLLQLVTGISRPTIGNIRVHGRVAGLLELGGGFNPAFSGRENVIFQSRVIGVSEDEIAARLPEIESFADIGEFFDQPVKTYSSGMQARLGFACSIFVDPEILIVDEALSVGDAKFQNKCFMQFERFQESGGTTLLVSHDTEAILRTCDHAILLDKGALVVQGSPQSVVDRYFEVLYPSGDRRPPGKAADEPRADEGRCDPEMPGRVLLEDGGICESRNSYNKNEFRFGDRRAEIADYYLIADGRAFPVDVPSGSQVTLLIRIKANQFSGVLSAGLALKSIDGIKLYGTNTISNKVALPKISQGDSIWVRFDFLLNVVPGDLFIDVGCGDWSTPPAQPLDRRHSLIHLHVTSSANFDGLVNCFGKATVLRANEIDLGASDVRTVP